MKLGGSLTPSTEGSFEKKQLLGIIGYGLGCPRVQDASHHQDYCILSTGSQLMVNWWLGVVVWILRIPLMTGHCSLGVSLESQTTGTQITNQPFVEIPRKPSFATIASWEGVTTQLIRLRDLNRLVPEAAPPSLLT